MNGIDVTANPGTHQYRRKTSDATVMAQIKTDIIAAFDYGTILIEFEPWDVVIVTMDNFTYTGGDENTPVREFGEGRG